MIIIPAIDLKGGKCVRLLQGDFDKATVYSSDPVETARKWQSQGAQRIHIVDLDGSLAGAPRNGELVKNIARAVSVPIEVGGGIRNLETAENYLTAGVRWVILGTAALKDRHFVEKTCALYPERVILGIDARGGRVAIEGWTEETGSTAIEFAKGFEGTGIDSIVYTDISRDGMETGVNLEATRALAEAVNIPVIASGGVSSLKDIIDLKRIEKSGISGVIVGKALYTGGLQLKDAIKIAKQL